MDKRKILFWVLVGAAVGEFLTVWLAPKYILWYFDPPVQMGFSCKEPIGWALHRLQSAQLVGLAIGAALGGAFWMIRRKKGPTNFPPHQQPPASPFQ